MAKFKVGDIVEVVVADQIPNAIGTVIAVSTWAEQHGIAHDNAPCYRIQCDSWETSIWIDENNLKGQTP